MSGSDEPQRSRQRISIIKPEDDDFATKIASNQRTGALSSQKYSVLKQRNSTSSTHSVQESPGGRPVSVRSVMFEDEQSALTSPIRIRGAPKTRHSTASFTGVDAREAQDTSSMADTELCGDKTAHVARAGSSFLNAGTELCGDKPTHVARGRSSPSNTETDANGDKQMHAPRCQSSASMRIPEDMPMDFTQVPLNSLISLDNHSIGSVDTSSTKKKHVRSRSGNHRRSSFIRETRKSIMSIEIGEQDSCSPCSANYWISAHQSSPVSLIQSKKSLKSTESKDPDPGPPTTSGRATLQKILRSAATSDHNSVGRIERTRSHPSLAAESPGRRTTYQTCSIDPGRYEKIIHFLSGTDDLFLEVMDCLAADQPSNPIAWLKDFFIQSGLLGDRSVRNSDESGSKSSLEKLSILDNLCDFRDELEEYYRDDEQNWRFYVYTAEKLLTTHNRFPDDPTGFISLSGLDIEQLESFLPKTLKHAIYKEEITVENGFEVMVDMPSFNPLVCSFYGVVVFADASGFTAMTEKLAKLEDGAQRIGELLNVFFCPLINLIDIYGGDIIKFSGDALQIVWPTHRLNSVGQKKVSAPQMDSKIQEGCARSDALPGRSDSRRTHTSYRVERAAQLALLCCERMHEQVARPATSTTQSNDTGDGYNLNMTLHIAVGIGQITLLQIGGVLDRWEYIFVGPPFDQIAQGITVAGSGETAISAELYSQMEDSNMFTFTRVDAADEDECEKSFYLANSPENGDDTSRRASSHPTPPVVFEVPRNAREWLSIDKRLLRRFVPASCWRLLDNEVSGATQLATAPSPLQGLSQKPRGAPPSFPGVTSTNSSPVSAEKRNTDNRVDDSGVRRGPPKSRVQIQDLHESFEVDSPDDQGALDAASLGKINSLFELHSPIPHLSVCSSASKFGESRYTAELMGMREQAKLRRRTTTLRLDNASFYEEMRSVTVLFAVVDGFDASTLEGAKTAQRIMHMAQRSVYSQEGSVNKCLMDDKGILLLCVFGLPPLSHFTDDPLRAALAGLRIVDTFREEDIAGTVGVATGVVWCGVIGNNLRREYTVLGDVVNTASRLMSYADNHTVLLDSASHKICTGTLEFLAEKRLKVKGKQDPIGVHQLTGRLVPRCLQGKEKINPLLYMWPQWPSLKEVRKILRPYSKGYAIKKAPDNHVMRSRTILISDGNYLGCGRPELVHVIQEWAEQNDFIFLFGRNMGVSNTFTVPLMAWKQIFTHMIDLAGGSPHWAGAVQKRWRRNAKQIMNASQTDRAETGSLLYTLLFAMLTSHEEYASLIPWLPLMGLLLPKLEFSNEVVAAMLNVDETLCKTKRFEQLCAAILDVFCSRLPETVRGVCVVIHLQNGTSFFQEKDDHTATIVQEIAMMVNKRRDKAKQESPARKGVNLDPDAPRSAPILFFITTKEGLFPLIDTMSLTPLVNIAIQLKNPSIRLMADFVAHAFSYIALDDYFGLEPFHHLVVESTCDIASSLPDTLVSYIYAMTFGNLNFVEALVRSFVAQGVATVRFNPKLERVDLVLSGYLKDPVYSELLARPLPQDIMATAISTFETLDPLQQNVVKHASVCDNEMGFSLQELASLMDLEFGVEVQTFLRDQCARLTKKRIFSEIEKRNPNDVDRWLFGGGLLQKVARSLVVKEQKFHQLAHLMNSADSRFSPSKNVKVRNAVDDTMDIFGNKTSSDSKSSAASANGRRLPRCASDPSISSPLNRRPSFNTVASANRTVFSTHASHCATEDYATCRQGSLNYNKG